MKIAFESLICLKALPWILAVMLSGCALYVPDSPGVVAAPQGYPQGGPGNDFCPPGQAKKGNC